MDRPMFSRRERMLNAIITIRAGLECLHIDSGNGDHCSNLQIKDMDTLLSILRHTLAGVEVLVDEVNDDPY